MAEGQTRLDFPVGSSAIVDVSRLGWAYDRCKVIAHTAGPDGKFYDTIVRISLLDAKGQAVGVERDIGVALLTLKR